MKKLLAIAALLLASSAAQAQYTFDYGGKTIRIDPDRGTVQIPGVYDNTGRKAKRSRDDDDYRDDVRGRDDNRNRDDARYRDRDDSRRDDARRDDGRRDDARRDDMRDDYRDRLRRRPPQDARTSPSEPDRTPPVERAPAEQAAVPPAPAPTAPVPAAPAPVEPSTSTAAVAPADTAPSAPPPPPQVQQEPPPAPRPSVAAIAPPPPASDPDSPLGVWMTEKKDGKDGKVRIEQCGPNLCGYSIDKRTGRNGEQVLINMRPGNNKWTGRIVDPSSGSRYDSTITLKGTDRLRVQGCAFGGMFCGGQTWTRLE